MPVASRASRATEVDALAADGERPRDSALIVVISLTALFLHESEWFFAYLDPFRIASHPGHPY